MIEDGSTKTMQEASRIAALLLTDKAGVLTEADFTLRMKRVVALAVIIITAPEEGGENFSAAHSLNDKIHSMVSETLLAMHREGV